MSGRGNVGRARLPTRFDLYELCAQSPRLMAAFLRAVHGVEPAVLREDFSGGGAVCREWVGLIRGGRAIAVDMDPEPLRRLAGLRRVRRVCADVMACDEHADVISATNFAIGYWPTRRDLVKYLRRTRRRLRPGGIFACDTYGGATAFTTGTLVRERVTESGLRVRYIWEQRSANPLTGRVLDAMHFRVFRGTEVVLDLPGAFVYDWRLWSIVELREAMGEAGFSRTEVYAEIAEGVDTDGRTHVRPVKEPDELPESYVVQVVARA